jgi:Penicillinase repressor.
VVGSPSRAVIKLRRLCCEGRARVSAGGTLLSCTAWVVLRVVEELGEVSVSCVLWELRRRYGVKLRRNSVRHIIQTLVEKGLVSRNEEGYYVARGSGRGS